MALKDWKKTKDEKHNIVFKTNNRMNAITLHKSIYNKEWNIDLLNEPLSTRRKFKTKSQALKYARAYMRKH